MTSTTPSIPASHHDILKGNNYAQVAMVMPDGSLANNVVAFVWDGEFVRFSTIKSRQKYKNLSHDQRVALCIVDPKNPWRYVEIRGKVDIQEDSERHFINSIAKKYMNQDHYPFDQPNDVRITFTLKPTRIRAEYVHAADGTPENIGIQRG